MAGIYLHIPFCKQKCHYCNFHSVASLKNKDLLLEALLKEIALQKNYLGNEKVETIYFGGGTPSLLSESEINKIFHEIQSNFKISDNAEVTIEANPDDLTKTYIYSLKKTPVNRLSIGVQSFFEEDLKYLNRVHSTDQAYNSIKEAQHAGFQNMSIDLIYGIPSLSETNWYKNLEIFFELNPPHLSAYALTVEPKTALDVLIRNNKTNPVQEKQVADHFQILIDQMGTNNYLHYEISNFCKENFYSKHNKSYWLGEKYLGLGPSSHSFDGDTRQWNVSNINKYISEINNNQVPAEKENLSTDQKYNEYILTSLRTMWGTDVSYILKKFGNQYNLHFKKYVKRFIDDKRILIKNGKYCLTDSGKIFADGISSDLFV